MKAGSALIPRDEATGAGGYRALRGCRAGKLMGCIHTPNGSEGAEEVIVRVTRGKLLSVTTTITRPRQLHDFSGAPELWDQGRRRMDVSLT